MEQDELYDELIGKKISIPQCAKCIFSEGSNCKKFNTEKIKLKEKGIDIFNCPEFKDKEEEQAFKLFKL